tara:strand:- start:650 stop:1612 length:963 start_codon:yes stop_codon:yes gene_type:complete
MENVNSFLGETKKNLINYTPYGTEKFISGTGEFVNSNTLIAKATFLLLIIIIFVFLFWVFSKIIFYFLTPSENPYILKGMKDATETMVIPQSLDDPTSIPIYRSKNQYHGVEFTYSFWMYVKDVEYNNNDFMHVFNKGSSNYDNESNLNGVYGPNNAPGVYLYTGKKNIAENLIDKYPVLGLLVRMNVYNDNDNKIDSKKYFDDIYVDGIPIKKWVNVVIRVTGQNIVDIYINGTLTKRHNLSNVVKQNYDNININLGNGFIGNLSNIKYYNYAIGTFEIYRISSAGPNLTMANNSNIQKSKPFYLSSDWYNSNTDPLTI